MSFFDEAGGDQHGRNWESTTVNNPFLCVIMLLHIILMQPYPQIVFPDTRSTSHNHCSCVKQWGEAFVELWDGVPEHTIWG